MVLAGSVETMSVSPGAGHLGRLEADGDGAHLRPGRWRGTGLILHREAGVTGRDRRRLERHRALTARRGDHDVAGGGLEQARRREVDAGRGRGPGEGERRAEEAPAMVPMTSAVAPPRT